MKKEPKEVSLAMEIVRNLKSTNNKLIIANFLLAIALILAIIF